MFEDWQPTAPLELLRRRSRLLARVREFLSANGYWEVETPLLSHDRVIDPGIEPFVIVDGRRELYLQTSPEFAMKRLLAAGADAIYQLGKVFRQGERGRRHNPEFTMLEWYRVGYDHLAQMAFVETLLRALWPLGDAAPLSASPFLRTTYAEAFARAGISGIHSRSVAELAECARQRKLVPPPGLADDDRDGWLNWLLVEMVEPQLGQEIPEFLYDYPASQAALARIRPGPPDVAERFELYYHDNELCNGYHEELNPDELRSRIRREWDGRTTVAPTESRLLAAMEAGLPACAGVALGFDRLVMLLLGRSDIADVIPFPIEHA